MDWLSGISTGDLGYTPSSINSIILTKNTSVEDADDTFEGKVKGVTDYISDDGVLHTGAGGQVSITHTTGDPLITASGTIGPAYGNDAANNHINSVCLVMGASLTTGGPGQGAYVVTGNEMVFARVNVGDLIKTVEKTYTFEWQLQVQTSS